MYEKLIKELRMAAQDSGRDNRYLYFTLINRSADAIEELSRVHEADAKEIEWLKMCVRDLPKPPKWIPVEERLPEPFEKQEAEK